MNDCVSLESSRVIEDNKCYSDSVDDDRKWREEREKGRLWIGRIVAFFQNNYQYQFYLTDIKVAGALTH